MIWVVIWTVLMILWLVWGGYTFDRARPDGLGGTLIPWVCVLILGLVIFGAISVGPINQAVVVPAR
jgi:hypothetical protein